MKLRWVMVAVLLLAGCSRGGTDVLRPQNYAPTTSPTPSASVSAAPRPVCAVPGVELAIGVKDAATGLRVVEVTLRNCGPGAYVVNGYPDVTLRDEHHRTLGGVSIFRGIKPVTLMEPDPGPPKRFVLAKGELARAVLVWRNITTDQATMINGAYVHVAPATGQPGQDLELAVDLGNTGKLGVGPWTPRP